MKGCYLALRRRAGAASFKAASLATCGGETCAGLGTLN